ncbi:TPA: hypothetical protein HA318_03550 [Candidatus Micrarchaeota archaeon]|nr:MAG: hypothetical protein AUJ65_03625 [Candidatus Micrarchaeota archaeon CG1_02_51_15]HII39050.1 hypothetical protein [Candidatus Micrarchaeota archaeon]
MDNNFYGALFFCLFFSAAFANATPYVMPSFTAIAINPDLYSEKYAANGFMRYAPELYANGKFLLYPFVTSVKD